MHAQAVHGARELQAYTCAQGAHQSEGRSGVVCLCICFLGGRRGEAISRMGPLRRCHRINVAHYKPTPQTTSDATNTPPLEGSFSSKTMPMGLGSSTVTCGRVVLLKSMDESGARDLGGARRG